MNQRKSSFWTPVKILVGLIVIAALALAISGGIKKFRKPPLEKASEPVVYTRPVDDPRVQAIAAAAKVAEQQPGSAQAWIALGDANLAKRQFRQAADAYRKGLAINPDQGAAWSALGEAVIQTVQSRTAMMPPEAALAFDEALKRNPGDMRAQFYKTMEMDFAGQHDQAIGRWLEMLRQVPVNSHESEAIRLAITASVQRNLRIVDRSVREAMASAPGGVLNKSSQAPGGASTPATPKTP